uniref:(northern house mosquito) hypothetical protein n=1 Tax=Culex pipiens TaxID=7175 RepID=A0A8D8A3A7_CULPI
MFAVTWLSWSWTITHHVRHGPVRPRCHPVRDRLALQGHQREAPKVRCPVLRPRQCPRRQRHQAGLLVAGFAGRPRDRIRRLARHVSAGRLPRAAHRTARPHGRAGRPLPGPGPVRAGPGQQRQLRTGSYLYAARLPVQSVRQTGSGRWPKSVAPHRSGWLCQPDGRAPTVRHRERPVGDFERPKASPKPGSPVDAPAAGLSGTVDVPRGHRGACGALTDPHRHPDHDPAGVPHPSVAPAETSPPPACRPRRRSGRRVFRSPVGWLLRGSRSVQFGLFAGHRHLRRALR